MHNAITRWQSEYRKATTKNYTIECVNFLVLVWETKWVWKQPESDYLRVCVCVWCRKCTSFVCTCIEWKTIAQICTKLLWKEKPARVRGRRPINHTAHSHRQSIHCSFTWRTAGKRVITSIGNIFRNDNYSSGMARTIAFRLRLSLIEIIFFFVCECFLFNFCWQNKKNRRRLLQLDYSALCTKYIYYTEKTAGASSAAAN